MAAPKRSGVSQTARKAKAVERLVQRLEADLAERATVEHDVRLPESQSGARRQVDVLVTFNDGYRTVRWAFEVKCHGRPVGPAVIEQWSTLQRDLDIQRVVIVSTSGYTHGARAKAKQHGVLLHDLEEALHDERRVVAPYVQHFRPTVRDFFFTPQVVVPKGTRAKLTPEKVQISVDGGDFQAPRGVLEPLAIEELNRRLRNQEVESTWDATPQTVEFDLPVEQLRIRVDGVPGVQLAGLHVRLTVQNSVSEVPIPMRRWTYQTHSDGAGREVYVMDLGPVMPNHSMEIAMEALPDGSRRITRIGPADPDLLGPGAADPSKTARRTR